MPPGVENGTGILNELAGATGTNATGLFGIYTQSLVHVTITANGQTVKRVLGGPVSNWLHDNVIPGSRIAVSAPLGSFTIAGQMATK